MRRMRGMAKREKRLKQHASCCNEKAMKCSTTHSYLAHKAVFLKCSEAALKAVGVDSSKRNKRFRKLSIYSMRCLHDLVTQRRFLESQAFLKNSHRRRPEVAPD